MRFRRPVLFVIPFFLAVVLGEISSSRAQTVPTLESIRTLHFSFGDVDRYPVVTAIAFASQNRFVTAGDDHQIWVWNSETGEAIQHFEAHNDWIRAIAVSPDYQGSPTLGQLATIGHDGTVKIWNGDDFSLVRTFSEKVPGAEAIAFSPNGKVLAVCGLSDRLYLFDAPTGNLIDRWATPENNMNAVQFSPNGEKIAVAGRNGVVRVWDTKSGAILADLTGDGRRIRALAFSPDNSKIVAGGDGERIVLWDLKTKREELAWKIGTGKTFSLVYCGEKTLASGDSFNNIRIWNLDSGKEIARASGHTGTIATLIFDATNKILVSGSFDTTVRFWSVKDAVEL